MLPRRAKGWSWPHSRREEIFCTRPLEKVRSIYFPQCMNYDNLIVSWHNKALGEGLFANFIFEYLAFIVYLRKKEYSDSQDERNAVQKLKQESMWKMRYQQEINRDNQLRQAWNVIIDELNSARLGNTSRGDLEEQKWWNCSHLNLDQMTREENSKTKGRIYNMADWENMVEFWCSIRNNLFHGGKAADDVRDQLLVDNGYITLRPVVDIFLMSSIRV